MSVSVPQPDARPDRWFGGALAPVGAALLVVAWFFPEWLAAGAAAGLIVSLGSPAARKAWAGGTLAVVAVVLLGFWIKDALCPGPLASAVAAFDAPVSFHARQPDQPGLWRHLATLGLVLLWLPAARAAMADGRRPLVWMRGAVVVLTSLAAMIVTHPSPKDYGELWQVGAVVSRNAAGGAFALGAVLAAGLSLAAYRSGRRVEGPLALLAALVCGAAVVALGSRGALAALAAGLAWCAWSLRGRRAVLPWLAGAAVVAGALFAAPGTVARLGDLGGGYRFGLWAESARVLARAPLGGLGGGGFEPGFALLGGMAPPMGMRISHPDSGWVLLAAEWGALGCILAGWAAWRSMRSGSSDTSGDPLRAAAAGALAALAVAAAGDISFHRPVLLVLLVPLLGVARPFAREGKSAGGIFVAWCAGLLAAALAGAAVWAETLDRRADDPARIDAALAVRMPLDARVHHALGLAALRKGEAAEAARHFALVCALEPGNILAAHTYARALMRVDPWLALPFWRREVRIADRHVADGLGMEMSRPDGPGARYWMRVVEDRPEFWLLPADSDGVDAQVCFERWRVLSAKVKALGPARPAVHALARWGTVGDLVSWWEGGPVVGPGEEAVLARDLRDRGRGDLAWAWLTRLLPPSAPAAIGKPEPGDLARVLADPDDHVAAARLIAGSPDDAEGRRLLRKVATRPGAPAWFRIRLAYAAKAEGRDAEALELLLAVLDGEGAAR